MIRKLRYRLALDLGTASLGWSMIRLNHDTPPQPSAVIKAGARIFSDGRDADGNSLAVSRRNARAMRRNRDRLIKRKARMIRTLVETGFFPADEATRKSLAALNPYVLRAKGLHVPLKPEEFARALFHITQRRGFKSNRKTDKKDNDSGALKTAIKTLRDNLREQDCKTVGEWLAKRHAIGEPTRARMVQTPIVKPDGKTRIDKSYTLYIDRAMIESEFDLLWARQSSFDPTQYVESSRAALKDCLLYQRTLKSVSPGRCTLLPELERAPLALPSTQRFRIYQEVNNLRILGDGLVEQQLSLDQRNDLVAALESNAKRSFTQMKKLLGLSGAVKFNFEDPKREEFKGNATSASLSKDAYFGTQWSNFSEPMQDEIVQKLISEENEAILVQWLIANCKVDEQRAEAIANVGLPEGYGSLSLDALNKIIPALRNGVVPYSQAVIDAGFAHHSNISAAADGEVLPELPYYGEALRRHVAFGTGKPGDPPEKRFGKIANATVHIGLNQVRKVVNTIIKRYGHPTEVIIELARDLKQSKAQRDDENKRQAENQKRNTHVRKSIAETLQISAERVRVADIQKWILWTELSNNALDRRCPYSGVQISASMLFSNEIEVEHILPFA